MQSSPKAGTAQCASTTEPARNTSAGIAPDGKQESIVPRTGGGIRGYLGTFNGTPCGRCGGTEKYYSGNTCVACKRAKQKARQREKPRRKDEPDYVPNLVLKYWLTRVW